MGSLNLVWEGLLAATLFEIRAQDPLEGVVVTSCFALVHFARFLQDSTTPIPLPLNWNDWEAYYHILQYEGNRTVDLH